MPPTGKLGASDSRLGNIVLGEGSSTEVAPAITAADTTSVSDSTARSIAVTRSASDTGAAGATVSSAGSIAREAADTVAGTDAISSAVGSGVSNARTASDTLSVSDSVSRVRGRRRTATDSVLVSAGPLFSDDFNRASLGSDYTPLFSSELAIDSGEVVVPGDGTAYQMRWNVGPVATALQITADVYIPPSATNLIFYFIPYNSGPTLVVSKYGSDTYIQAWTGSTYAQSAYLSLTGWVSVKLNVEGRSSGYVRAKIWQRGDAEPASWNINATQTTTYPTPTSSPSFLLQTDVEARLDNLAIGGRIAAADSVSVARAAGVADTVATTESISTIVNTSANSVTDSVPTTESVTATKSLPRSAADTGTVRDFLGHQGPVVDGLVFYDRFDRTESGTLGVSSSGYLYQPSSLSSDVSVSGGYGRAAAQSSAIAVSLPAAEDVGTEYWLDFYIGPNDTGLQFPYYEIDGAFSGQWCYLFPTSTTQWRINVGETASLDFTITPNTWYRLRFRPGQLAGDTDRAKVWRVADSEPASWQIEAPVAADRMDPPSPPQQLWFRGHWATEGLIDNVEIRAPVANDLNQFLSEFLSATEQVDRVFVGARGPTESVPIGIDYALPFITRATDTVIDPAAPTYQTSLASDAASGATSVEVVSPSFNTVPFTADIGGEAVTVTSVSGTTWTLSAPLSGSYATGTPVTYGYAGVPGRAIMAQVTVGPYDITRFVQYEKSSWTTFGNGQPGTGQVVLLRAPDLPALASGMEMVVRYRGIRVWGGYVETVSRTYAFPSGSGRGATEPGFITLGCVDYNILFRRRIFFDQADPTNMEVKHWPNGTADSIVLAEVASRFVDLSADGLSFEITHVGTPAIPTDSCNPDAPDDFGVGSAGWAWGDVMDAVAQQTGAVYYIDPDRVLRYVDDATAQSAFGYDGLSDDPAGTMIGYREMELSFDGTQLVNDQFTWGVGQGADHPVLGHVTDAASIAAHGLWQNGELRYDMYCQDSVDVRAESWIYGSPQNRRGGKDPKIVARCTVLVPFFRVADVVQVAVTSHGFSQPMPIRGMEITFPTPWDIRCVLTASHEIDAPWSAYEFMFPDLALPDFRMPGMPPFDFLPPWLPPYDPCAQDCSDRGAPSQTLQWYEVDQGSSTSTSIDMTRSAQNSDIYPYGTLGCDMDKVLIPGSIDDPDGSAASILRQPNSPTTSVFRRLGWGWQESSGTSEYTGYGSDSEGFSILSYANPLKNSGGCWSVRLTAKLRTRFFDPWQYDMPVPPVEWTLYACDYGDPSVSMSLPAGVSSPTARDWLSIPGARVVATGVHPGGSVLQTDLDVSWNVDNPDYIQFFIVGSSPQGTPTEPIATIFDRGTFMPNGDCGQRFGAASTLGARISSLDVVDGLGAEPTHQLMLYGTPCSTPSGSGTAGPGALLVEDSANGWRPRTRRYMFHCEFDDLWQITSDTSTSAASDTGYHNQLNYLDGNTAHPPPGSNTYHDIELYHRQKTLVDLNTTGDFPALATMQGYGTVRLRFTAQWAASGPSSVTARIYANVAASWPAPFFLDGTPQPGVWTGGTLVGTVTFTASRADANWKYDDVVHAIDIPGASLQNDMIRLETDDPTPRLGLRIKNDSSSVFSATPLVQGTTGCIETFTRSVAAGIGTSEAPGGEWAPSSSPSYYSVTGTELLAQRPAVLPSQRTASLSWPVTFPFEVLFKTRWEVDGTPTGDATFHRFGRIMLVLDQSTGSPPSDLPYERIEWRVQSPSGSPYQSVLVAGDGPNTGDNYAAGGLSDPSWTPQTPMYSRWRIQADRVQLKVWPVASPEPATWGYDFAKSFRFSWSSFNRASFYVGLVEDTGSGGFESGVRFYMDSYQITDPCSGGSDPCAGALPGDLADPALSGPAQELLTCRYVDVGGNMLFATKYQFQPNSTEVWMDGVRLRLGIDYDEDWRNRHILLHPELGVTDCVTAPVISASYRIWTVERPELIEGA